MYTPWVVIVQDIVRGGTIRTPDFVRYAYAQDRFPGMVFQSLAQVLMSFDAEQGMRTQGYALEHYRTERLYQSLVACAYDSLFFPALRMSALGGLLDAAMSTYDDQALVQSGQLICQFHANGDISTPQLLSLFFTVIVPYYHKKARVESVLAIRRVLCDYNLEYSHLLYTHLQANLYAYTTDIAQELIGEPDAFAGG